MAWTAPPTHSAIVVSANVSRLIAVVAAIIVKVATPQGGDAFAVVARKLGLRMAVSIMANIGVFIGSVVTVLVSIAFPRTKDTPASTFALEFVFRTVVRTLFLIGSIAAIVNAVANGGGLGAV